MRHVKMFGLAALAALMAMTFVGASLAMAENTVLCSNDSETSCAEITHVHETSVGKAKLLAEGLPAIECTVLFLGDTIAGTSAPLVLKGAFTYSSCNNFCSVTEENGPAEMKILRSATELGSFTGEFLVHLNCPFINCSYNGEGLSGHGLGALTSASANGNVVITKQLLHKETGGAICPEEVFLDFTTTPLVKTSIKSMQCVSRAGGLYKNNAGGGVCTEDVVSGNLELVWL